MLKQAYRSLPRNTNSEGVICWDSLTLIILTTSRTVMKDMESTFQHLFDVPACCFNHSMKATSAYVNQTMTIFFFIKSQKFFVKF